MPKLMQMMRRKRFCSRFQSGRIKPHAPYTTEPVSLRKEVEEPAVRRPEGLPLVDRGAFGQRFPLRFRNQTVVREPHEVGSTLTGARDTCEAKQPPIGREPGRVDPVPLRAQNGSTLR